MSLCAPITFIIGIHMFTLNGSPTKRIQTPSGTIRGCSGVLPVLNKPISVYLGIPYAKAERFERPVPPDSWPGVKTADRQGKVCPQPSDIGEPFGYQLEDMSDDCLNLNIYVPRQTTRSTDDELLPVMVWIHGGGFAANSNREVEGTVLATLGNVVVVTINYRLGILGFLSCPAYDMKGNYGLYDQLEALKWVKENIAKFGGDPSKVTIFGNSAGGVSVSILSMTPLAQGLFKYTIMQSGVANMPIAYNLHEIGKEWLIHYMKDYGCQDSNMKECLKSLSIATIDHVMKEIPQTLYTPIVDEQFLTTNPLDMVKNTSNTLNPERVMIGVADDDGSCFTDAIPELSNGQKLFNSSGVTSLEVLRINYTLPYIFQDAKLDPSHVMSYLEAVENTYIPSNTDFSNTNETSRIVLNMIKDIIFYAPGVAHANAYATRNIPTFFYEVKYALPLSRYFTVPPVINAYHEAEKFIVFGFNERRQDEDFIAGKRLSREVIRMWSNFAKSGDPNRPVASTSDDAVNWPQYTSSNQRYLVIKPTMEVRQNIRQEQVNLWNDVLPSIGQEPESNTKITKKKTKKKQKSKQKYRSKKKFPGWNGLIKW